MEAPSRPARPFSHYLGQLLTVAALYAVTGRLCFMLAPTGAPAAPAWAPSGVGLAALLLGGRRLWPAVVVGSFALSFWNGVALPLPAALGAAAAATLEALAGASIFRAISGDRGSIERLVTLLALTLAAAVSTLLGAAVGTMSLVASGVIVPGRAALALPAWWAGGFLGNLIVTPLALAWATHPRPERRAWKTAEALAVSATAVSVALTVFWAPHPYSQPYLMFLPLIWAALRFGPRGATAGMLVVTGAAIGATAGGRGTFAPLNTENFIELSVFLAATSLGSLTLAAVVTELSRSREEHAESEARLRAFMEGTPDAVWVLDRHGRYEMLNTAAHRTLGVPDGAGIGTEPNAWIPPGQAALSREVDLRVMSTERPASLELAMPHHGENRYLHIHKGLYRDHAGQVAGTISVGRDISDRRAAEHKLEASEELLRLAVEAAGLGVWSWEPQNNRLVWSPLCRQAYGVGPAEQITYARFLGAIHPDDRAMIAHAVEEALAGHSAYRVEHRVVLPDGTVRWNHVLGRVYRDEADQAHRMLGVVMDITPQKRIAEERSRLFEAERAARTEAESATRAKDSFLAVLSHELRTPLQAMSGWAHILRGPHVDALMQKKGLDTIARAVRTQSLLIEDLLDVSRIVAGKLYLAHERVDLEEVVAAALDSARTSASAKALRLEISLASLGGEVMGDATRLHQVVSNLLTNAVKFTPAQGRVSVRLERVGATARLQIEDTGRGISPDFLPQVFDRFRQADSSFTRAQGGLGLGLAIVRHLVEQHGGTVHAESPGEGRGATFTVTLPLVAPSATATARNGTTANHMPGPAPLVDLRILAVDDDPDARVVLEAILRDSGAEFRVVPSTRAAVDEFERFRPHVLLADIGMPEEDGYALLQKVREKESVHGGHVAAIALTAFAGVADRREALEFGFDAHLAKPATPAELVRTIAAARSRSVQ